MSNWKSVSIAVDFVLLNLEWTCTLCMVRYFVVAGYMQTIIFVLSTSSDNRIRQTNGVVWKAYCIILYIQE